MSEVARSFASLGVCKSFLRVAGAFAVAALTFLGAGAGAEAQSSVTAKWTKVVTGGFPQFADVVAADSAGNVIVGGVWGINLLRSNMTRMEMWFGETGWKGRGFFEDR